MSGVTDHTVLVTMDQTPLYGQTLLRLYAQHRRILVVPAVSLMVARRIAHAANGLAELFEETQKVVVRFVDLDAAAALRIGAQVEHFSPDDFPEWAGEWTVLAPVVWAARELGMPVLTRVPEFYRDYGVPVTPIP